MSPSMPRQVRWKLFAHTPPSAAAFPKERAGRLLRYVFRGLLDVYSHCNLHAHGVAKTTLCTEGSSSFVTSTAASVVTGWNEPVPGWGYLPLKSTGFSRRTAPLPLQQLHRCRVGGAASGLPDARPRPPLKPCMQFSRTRLSRRLSLPECNYGY